MQREPDLGGAFTRQRLTIQLLMLKKDRHPSQPGPQGVDAGDQLLPLTGVTAALDDGEQVGFVLTGIKQMISP